MTLGIVGLGLIGGSLGLCFKKSGKFSAILGCDNNPLHTQQALSLGLVDECVEFAQIAKCDVIILATPLEAIASLLRQLGEFPIAPHQLIMDVGGAKEAVLAAVPPHIRANFVATHPMKGTEFSGPKAAQSDFFAGAIVILSDLENSGESQAALARELLIAIGAKIVRMGAKEHDERVAFISHMPHVASFALSNVVLAQEEPESILALAGGGFRSMSRISKSSPLMWRDVFKQNRANTLKATRLLVDELSEAIKMLESSDFEGLEKWMERANKLHEIM